MGLAITDDHQALADVVREFARSNGLRALTRALLDAPPGAGTGGTAAPADPGPVWKQIAELGWLGLHLAEEHGGSGFGLAEAAIVAEGLGAAPAPGPFFPSVTAAAVIAATGSPEQRAALLPSLADGTLIISVAPVTAVVTASAEDGALTGEVPAALGAAWAHLHLVPAGADLALVVAGTPGLTVSDAACLDPSLGIARLSLDNVTARETLPGGTAVATRVLRVLAAAEAAGGARAALEMALDYAKVRVQFGRAIGGFQAVKHHLANMLVATELATAAAWDAARLDQAGGGGEAELAAAVAAAVALDAYQFAARKNIQVLGGIGFTWEHDAHLYLRRAAALAALAGPVRQAQDDVFALSKAGVRRTLAVDLPPEAEDYRTQAREFRERYDAVADDTARRALLVDEGYLVPHWKKPWGRAATPVEQLVIEEELAGLDIPSLGIGGWVLLTLTQQAGPEQIERWIDPSLRGDLVWCQLFSEPNAGSDAASVQTRGTRVAGGWRVSGQKVWTSGAQYCNRGLATIRTDPSAAKHKGITAMVIDLTAPGVEVRPLREITGEALFNEVFFDDVFVPDSDVVGEVNQGWTVARATLGNERVSIGGGSRQHMSAFGLADLHAAHAPGDPGVAREIGQLVAEEVAADLISLRQVERAVSGAGPSPEGNVTKLLSAEQAQRVGELALDISAAAVGGGEPGLGFQYLFDRALSIAGGTSEVGRNVIAERILGLPREPNMK
ncbi:MAG TPA: acyl-CoA dehydrogenase [Trebonia sp.]|jgi:alkylation response protein AidB-like acyl-CoA dehydrogenase